MWEITFFVYLPAEELPFKLGDNSDISFLVRVAVEAVLVIRISVVGISAVGVSVVGLRLVGFPVVGVSVVMPFSLTEIYIKTLVYECH